MLFELVRHQPQCQPGAVNRHIYLTQKERQRPDMVFMAMSQKYRLDLVGPVPDVGKIGNNQIDPQNFVLWKTKACIDDQYAPVIFHDHHVLADFAKAAEGDYFQFGFTGYELSLIHISEPT